MSLLHKPVTFLELHKIINKPKTGIRDSTALYTTSTQNSHCHQKSKSVIFLQQYAPPTLGDVVWHGVPKDRSLAIFLALDGYGEPEFVQWF